MFWLGIGVGIIIGLAIAYGIVWLLFGMAIRG